MEVAIIKYNAGNIRSVVNAFRRLGVEPAVTDDPAALAAADRVVFPGQGEASSTMAYLRARSLDRVITSLRQPVLGICIGQQLLCAHSGALGSRRRPAALTAQKATRTASASYPPE